MTGTFYGVNIRDGNPNTLWVPPTARDDGVQVGVGIEEIACALRHHNHASPEAIGPNRSCGHHLVHRLVRRAAELPEQVAVVQEVRADHPRNAECPHPMGDLLQDLVTQEGAELSCPLRPT